MTAVLTLINKLCVSGNRVTRLSRICMYSSQGKCCTYPSMHVICLSCVMLWSRIPKIGSVYVPCMQLQRRVQSDNGSWLHNMFCRHEAGWNQTGEARAVEESSLHTSVPASCFNMHCWTVAKAPSPRGRQFVKLLFWIHASPHMS